MVNFKAYSREQRRASWDQTDVLRSIGSLPIPYSSNLQKVGVNENYGDIERRIDLDFADNLICCEIEYILLVHLYLL